MANIKFKSGRVLPFPDNPTPQEMDFLEKAIEEDKFLTGLKEKSVLQPSWKRRNG